MEIFVGTIVLACRCAHAGVNVSAIKAIQRCASGWEPPRTPRGVIPHTPHRPQQTNLLGVLPRIPLISLRVILPRIPQINLHVILPFNQHTSLPKIRHEVPPYNQHIFHPQIRHKDLRHTHLKIQPTVLPLIRRLHQRKALIPQKMDICGRLLLFSSCLELHVF